MDENTIVTVYRFGKEVYLKNSTGNFESLIEGYPLVAYNADTEELYQYQDAHRYSKGSFVQDMLQIDGTEMSYKMYLDVYKAEMNKKHISAPVLTEIYENQHQNPHLTDDLKPVNAFDKLSKLGLNFKISR